MANLGTASLILSTESTKLHSGLNEAGKTMHDWKKSSDKKMSEPSGEKGGGFLKSMLGAGLLGGAAGIGFSIGEKIMGGLEGFGEKADKAGKFARSLGMPTEALSSMMHAADLSGISIEQLHKGFAHFRKEVGGPMDEAIMAFAAQLEGVSDPGEKAQMAVQAFGKSGVDMLPMFEKGADGLKEMMEEAVRLGIAFNDVDAHKMEEAKDSITRLKSALQGVMNRALIAIAPLITKVAEAFLKGFEAAKQFFEQFGEWINDADSGLAKYVGKLGSVEDVTISLAKNTGYWIVFLVSAWKDVGSAAQFAWGMAIKGMADFMDKLSGDKNRPWWTDLQAGFVTMASKSLHAMGIMPKADMDHYINDAINVSKKAWERNRKEGGDTDEMRAYAERMMKASGMIGTFENAKRIVDKFFADTSAKFNKAKEMASSMTATMGVKPLLAGSKELYETTLKINYERENKVVDVMKEILGLDQERNKVLQGIDRKLDIRKPVPAF